MMKIINWKIVAYENLLIEAIIACLYSLFKQGVEHSSENPSFFHPIIHPCGRVKFISVDAILCIEKNGIRLNKQEAKMFDTRLAYQVVDWERRIQIENEKHGNPSSDKYALFPHAARADRKADKPVTGGLFASLKTVPFLSIILG